MRATLALTFLALLGACAAPETSSAPAASAGQKTEAAHGQHPGRVFVSAIQTAEADAGLARMAEAALTSALAMHFPDGVASYQEVADVAKHAAIGGALGADEMTGVGELAGQVDADFVILGSLNRAGELLSLDVAIFDARQARVVNRISERRREADALIDAIAPAVHGMYALPGRVVTAQIKTLVRSKIGLVKHCYNRQLETEPTLAGKAMVKFVIRADGTVSDVAVDPEQSTLTNPAFVSCIEVAIMSLNLGYQIEQEVSVAYPFAFRPD